MNTVTVAASKTYDIHIGPGLLSSWAHTPRALAKPSGSAW